APSREPPSDGAKPAFSSLPLHVMTPTPTPMPMPMVSAAIPIAIATFGSGLLGSVSACVGPGGSGAVCVTRDGGPASITVGDTERGAPAADDGGPPVSSAAPAAILPVAIARTYGGGWPARRARTSVRIVRASG